MTTVVLLHAVDTASTDNRPDLDRPYRKATRRWSNQTRTRRSPMTPRPQMTVVLLQAVATVNTDNRPDLDLSCH
jgi:hypothetical protein